MINIIITSNYLLICDLMNKQKIYLDNILENTWNKEINKIYMNIKFIEGIIINK